MYLHHNRQGVDIVSWAPKHDPLIKWPTWGHMTVWKIYISIFLRFMADKLGRLLTLGRIFITQTLKSSRTSYLMMLSACPSSFFKQSSYIGTGMKIVNKDAIWTAIELGPPVSESSTKISKFYAPNDSEQKFHESENRKLATHRIQAGVPLVENPQT